VRIKREEITIPNLLTSVRIVVVPFIVIEVLKERMHAAFYIFFIGGITDLLDGFIARRFNMVTKTGAFLDPAADKIFMVPTIIVLSLKGLIPSWACFIFVGKDLFIALSIGILYLIKKNVPINPTFAGKSAMFLEGTYLFFVMIDAFINGSAPVEILKTSFLYISVLSAILAGLSYIPVGMSIIGLSQHSFSNVKKE